MSKLKDSIYIYKVKSPVYLRDSSTVNSKALTTLNKGDILEVSDSINNWYAVKVKDKNLNGFVGKTFVEKDEPTLFDFAMKKDFIFPFLLSLIFCFFIIRLLIRKRAQKKYRELIESVTSLHRGTPSERDLITLLLKYGFPSNAIFHDLYVKKNKTEFSQIDLVLATKKGIIVFEVKDYKGWIFGNSNHTNWTQTLSFGKIKNRFYNPIKQNNNHVRYLKNTLEQFDQIPLYSVIVFYGDCVLKDINYVPKGTFIVKPHRIFEVLDLIMNNYEEAKYTDKEEIKNLLNSAVDIGNDNQIKEKHTSNIREILGKDRIYD